MSINSIPNAVFYDPDSWIDLAPDFDWDRLIPEPPAEPEPEPTPEGSGVDA